MSESLNSSLSPVFHIGAVPIYGDTILAPMDGFSDWPFRSLCSELGSALSYTEFVRADFVVKALKHMRPRLKFTEAERPVAFQLYGSDPDELLQGALQLQSLSPDIIDLNMGCPADSVTDVGAGVSLMRSPLKVARIFNTLSRGLTVPLTAKIRLGWQDDLNYRLIARIIEENGGAAIALHGRTQEQGYRGRANWDAIAEVKQAARIPVIGNGDVRSVADIEKMKQYTGCDAVMIGRAAVGNPWIFARLERAQVSTDTLLQMVHQHLHRSMAFYGDYRGLSLFRRHAQQYLKFRHMPRPVRLEIIEQKDAGALLALLDAYFANTAARG
jgi:nifR3 family TIM-barrel protein